MRTTLFALFSLSVIASDMPHPSRCLNFEAVRVNSNFWEASGVNSCDVEIPVAIVQVKFFNAKWERIGVDAFVLNHVAPHERFRPKFPVRGNFGATYRYVGIRAITTDTADLLR